ncbi:MAG TPA: type IV secretion system DNA-binding domain-containing protein [Steroidobacteraceae bacterium]|nr:type IV secretion system DNA-binding domain-containing protein [Steroidobacteraceae bacterium]
MSVSWLESRHLLAIRHAVMEALLAIALPVAVALSRRSGAREAHKRGARILDGRAAQRRAARLRHMRPEPPLTLAGVAIAPDDEVKHFKLIGTTGTGKSTAIRELLAAALDRGDRAVITDPDGGYLARYYDPGRGDVILNPFDSRSVQWDPFAEMREPYDAEQLASSLIPSSEDASGREWRGYARTFLAAVVRRCHEAGRRNAAELWRLIAMAPGAELRPIVANTPAQPFLEPENARMFGSIRSVAGSAAAALEHVQAQRARTFSVRDWIGGGRGALFLPYQANQIAALRTIIATWVRLAIFETMSEDGDQETGRRLWLIVDELDALGAIDGLKDALARLRKFGGCCVLGFQSLAQVSSTYGAGEAQTLVENCANTLILRCSSSEHGGTSQFASRLIGEREVVRRSTARGRDGSGFPGGRGWRRSTNVSEQRVTEAAVLASELEQLPDLTGYLKTASSAVWLRVRLRHECH